MLFCVNVFLGMSILFRIRGFIGYMKNTFLPLYYHAKLSLGPIGAAHLNQCV